MGKLFLGLMKISREAFLELWDSMKIQCYTKNEDEVNDLAIAIRKWLIAIFMEIIEPVLVMKHVFENGTKAF